MGGYPTGRPLFGLDGHRVFQEKIEIEFAQKEYFFLKFF
jgi:hypothetical protein